MSQVSTTSATACHPGPEADCDVDRVDAHDSCASSPEQTAMSSGVRSDGAAAAASAAADKPKKKKKKRHATAAAAAAASTAASAAASAISLPPAAVAEVGDSATSMPSYASPFLAHDAYMRAQGSDHRGYGNGSSHGGYASGYGYDHDTMDRTDTMDASRASGFGALEASPVFYHPTPLPRFERQPTTQSATCGWVKQHRFSQKNLMRKGADGKCIYTHLGYGALYGLGTLHVPESMREEFAEKIVSDFGRGFYTAFSENPDPDRTMHFYLDYDLDSAQRLRDEDWDRVEALEKRVVATFYRGVPPTDDLFRSLVLTSGMVKKQLSPGVTRYKSGVHVVYQHLFVTQEQAMHIAGAIQAAAKVELADISFASGIDWCKCIDLAVYGPGRGLRWAWQLKDRVCTACGTVVAQAPGSCVTGHEGSVAGAGGGGAGAGGASSGFAGLLSAPASLSPFAVAGGPPPSRALRRTVAGCPRCYHGIVPDVNASRYVPTYFVCGDLVREFQAEILRTQPDQNLLLMSSIAYNTPVDPTPGFVVPPGSPSLAVIVTSTRAAAGGGAAGTAGAMCKGGAVFGGNRLTNTSTGPLGAVISVGPEQKRSSAMMDLPRTDGRFEVIVNAVRRWPTYAHAAVTAVRCNETGSLYWVNTDSRYCQNKCAEHGNAGVWFIITKRGIAQKCFHKRADIYRDGGKPCSKYASEPHRLLDMETRVLFTGAVLVAADAASRREEAANQKARDAGMYVADAEDRARYLRHARSQRPEDAAINPDERLTCKYTSMLQQFTRPLKRK